MIQTDSLRQQDLAKTKGSLGVKRTNGVKFNESFYGPWTVNYSDGTTYYRGYRYERKNLGKWKHYNLDGSIKNSC